MATVLLLVVRPPSTLSFLRSDSELVLGSVAGPVHTELVSVVEVGGLGGRGGGAGMEARSSPWVKESTLGVEDGRYKGGGCGVDAGRGIW